MRLKNRTLSADLAALMVVFIWGINFVFVKAALAEFNVYAFVFVRYAAMVVLGWVVVAAMRTSRADLRAVVSDRRQLLIAAALGFSLYIPLSMFGLSFTTAFSNSLLIALAPLFMTVLLWLVGSEAISRGHMLGLALAIAGTMLLVTDALASGNAGLGLGDAISVLAALFYAGYNVANKSLVMRHSAAVVTTVTLTIGALPVMLVCIPGLLAQDWRGITIWAWAALGFSAVFPVYLAWSVWGWANARVGVARTSLFIYLVPVFGGGAAWLLGQERFTALKIAGAAVILAGLAAPRLTTVFRRPAVSAVKITPDSRESAA
jgi:drug/metabolite transporter (DMT)-like permease